MTIKVLAIGDTANVITDLKKYSIKSDIHQIIFDTQANFLIRNADTEIIKEYNIFKTLKLINSIKKKFDCCVVTGWTAAKIAYLANLDYLISFVGTDIKEPPFEKRKKKLTNNTKDKLNFFERKFYRSVLDNAIFCVTGGAELYEILKKYRKDAIRIDNMIVDENLFDLSIKPLKKPKKKFTFFCPQRLSFQKGFDIIWKAIPLCKTDFEILQVEWYDDELTKNDMIKKILTNKPPQVKLIPIILREEMIQYYNYCDAVIADMNSGFLGGVAREGSFCRKPVLNYINSKYKTVLDGKEIVPPFVPESKDLKEIAATIDKIVSSKEFCEQLVYKQYEFIEKLTDPIKTVTIWEAVFEDILKKKTSTQKRGNSALRLMGFLLGRTLRKITQF